MELIRMMSDRDYASNALQDICAPSSDLDLLLEQFNFKQISALQEVGALLDHILQPLVSQALTILQ
jgi:hypothetical protein